MAGGAPTDAYWDQTPRMVVEVINARASRDMDAFNHGIEMAWTTAALQRVKEMPALERLIGNDSAETKSREQTPEEMDAALTAWVDVMNIKFGKKD